jgi:hypothetical protein
LNWSVFVINKTDLAQTARIDSYHVAIVVHTTLSTGEPSEFLGSSDHAKLGPFVSLVFAIPGPSVVSFASEGIGMLETDHVRLQR